MDILLILQFEKQTVNVTRIFFFLPFASWARASERQECVVEKLENTNIAITTKAKGKTQSHEVRWD